MFKKFLPVIFFGLLSFFAFSFTQDASAQVVRLDSFSPDRSAPNQQVVASGYSLCSNTRINFYLLNESSFPKAENVTATALDCDTLSPSQTVGHATQFRFLVPNLNPNIYQVRLKRYDGTMSEWLNFEVLPFAMDYLTLTSPVNGTTTDGFNPILRWDYRFKYCYSGTYNCTARFQWTLKEGSQVVATSGSVPSQANTITGTSVTLSSANLQGYNAGKLKSSTAYSWEVNLFLVRKSDGSLESMKRQEAYFATAASGAAVPPPVAITPGSLPAPASLSCVVADQTTACPSQIAEDQFPIYLGWDWQAAGLQGAEGVWLEVKNLSSNRQLVNEWNTEWVTYVSRLIAKDDIFPVSQNTSFEWRVKACREQNSTAANCSVWATKTFTAKKTSAAGGGTGPGPGGGTAVGGTCTQECPEGQICNPLTVCDVPSLLNSIMNFIFWIGLAVAPVMFIIAGLLFITSAGDPNRAQGGKKMMLYTILGLVTLLFAKGLVKVIQSILGARS